MSQTLNTLIAVAGIDIGKNSFHVVGQDERGAIVLRQRWSRAERVFGACPHWVKSAEPVRHRPSGHVRYALTATPTAEVGPARRTVAVPPKNQAVDP